MGPEAKLEKLIGGIHSRLRVEWEKLPCRRELEELAGEVRAEPVYLARLALLLGCSEATEMLRLRGEEWVHRTIRVNTLKIGRSRLLELLRGKGVVAREYNPTPYGVIVEESPVSIGALHEYLYGYYVVQGPASMQVVLALQPSPTSTVLDACSGAGVKATQAAQHAHRGVIVSVDVSRRKLLALKNHASRMGVTNILAVNTDATKIKLGISFDRVLVDAPCTGEGLLVFQRGRRRWRRLSDLLDRAKLQLRILMRAAEHLASGGLLVYSTCSLAPEENEAVVQLVVEEFGLKPYKPQLDIPALPGVNEYLGEPLPAGGEACVRLTPVRHRTEGFTICRLRG